MFVLRCRDRAYWYLLYNSSTFPYVPIFAVSVGEGVPRRLRDHSSAVMIKKKKKTEVRHAGKQPKGPDHCREAASSLRGKNVKSPRCPPGGDLATQIPAQKCHQLPQEGTDMEPDRGAPARMECQEARHPVTVT